MTDDTLPDDPLGRRRDLVEALAAPDLTGDGPVAQRAAAWVLVALGRCLLADVSLPPGAAERAAAARPTAVPELVRQLGLWTESAHTLGKRWLAADPWEADDLCSALIELRTDAWAAETALDELQVPAPEVRA